MIDARSARMKAKGRSAKDEIQELMDYINDEIEAAATEGKTDIFLDGPNGEFNRPPKALPSPKVTDVISELHKAGYIAVHGFFWKAGALARFTGNGRNALYISWENA